MLSGSFSAGPDMTVADFNGFRPEEVATTSTPLLNGSGGRSQESATKPGTSSSNVQELSSFIQPLAGSSKLMTAPPP